MKKLIAIVMMMLVISFAMFFYGCKNSDHKDYISELAKEKEEREANLRIASDSIVSLSFCGLTLGEPVSPMLSKAIKDKKIWDVRQKNGDGVIRFKSNIFLPQQENPLCVDVVVTTFNDSISSICLISEDYGTHQELIDLYISKYNDKYASLWDNRAELWENNARRSGNDSKVWTFQNQTLRVSNFYEEERENYVKDSRMKSPENRYGVKYTKYFKSIVILYSDIKLCEKAEEYQKAVESQLKVELQEESERKQKQQQIKAETQDI